ncbi:MAG TPA: tyrosine-type recombinase/integrase [Candidatus Xenobia bacterium]|jgi:site-specific recombinase XerD
MLNLTPHEMKALLAAIDTRHPFGPRDYFLMVFDWHTGLRVTELVSIDVSDVSLDGQPRQELHLRATTTKGHMGRLVPLNAIAQKAVAKILEFNRKRGLSVEPDAPLFQTRRHVRLTARTVQWFMSVLREKAGLDFRATPHSIRHGFAVQALERSGNLRAVQKLLGHRRLTSTEVYTNPRRDELQRVVDTLVDRH